MTHRPSPYTKKGAQLACVALGLLLVGWGWVHALTPREDAHVDAEMSEAAVYVKSLATPRDYVLVRPTFELRGARAFLPLQVGVYKSPVPALWKDRDRIFVVTAHGAQAPRALRAALHLAEERAFGSVRVYRFDVRRP